MKPAIQTINPDGLSKNPAYSQAIATQGNGKTVYIGGQNSVNIKHEVVGKGDLAAQTKQVMQNIQTILADCGGSFAHVIKLSIHVVQGQDIMSAFKASQSFLKDTSNPPTVTVLFVAGLGNPDFLLEIDGIAFIPA
jgi:enamine deaminase RidA (YjgF/YER057c/UK114 family)